MKKSILMLAFAIATLTAVSCGKKENTETAPEQTTTEQTAPEQTTSEQTSHEHKEGDKHQIAYACPMDCEKGKTYDKPGKCPVCKMDLVEVAEEGHEEHHH